VKLLFPPTEYFAQFNSLFEFEKYPVSLKKLSICDADYNPHNLKISLGRFKALRDLEIRLKTDGSTVLMKSVCELISQVPSQFEALSVNLVEDFSADISICAALKRLTKLRRIRFEISVARHNDWPIIRALEGYELEYLNLRIRIRSNQDLGLIQKFLETQKGLKVLKLHIQNQGSLKILRR